MLGMAYSIAQFYIGLKNIPHKTIQYVVRKGDLNSLPHKADTIS
jgi:hypothetical protein